MEPFFILTEKDFRRWVKDAVKEYFAENRASEKNASSPEEPLLTRKEVASKLRISLVTLTAWVKGGLPSHKQNGKVYFLYSEVMLYIKTNRKGEMKRAWLIGD